MLVALVVGLGGGYGGARFLAGSASQSELETRDKKIAELQETLSELKFDSEDAKGQEQLWQDKISALEEQLAAAERTKQALRAEVDSAAEKARATAQAELDALQRTLDEAGDVNGELGRARKSLKVAELQIIDLEKAAQASEAEIRALEARQAESAKLEKANADLRASLAVARKQLDGLPRLQDQVAQLKQQLASQAADADATARRQIADLTKERDALERKLAAALDASGNSDRDGAEIARLKKELNAANATLVERDADARDLERKLKTAAATIADQTSRIDALTRTIENLKVEAAKGTTNADDIETDKVDPQVDEPLVEAARDADAVSAAIDKMPGASRLSEARRAKLQSGLEKGGCVTDPLKAVYGKVPPLALISLMRDLDSQC